MPRVLGRYLDFSHLWLLCRLSMKQMSVCRADIALVGAAGSSFRCGANYGHQLGLGVWVAALPSWRSLPFPSLLCCHRAGWCLRFLLVLCHMKSALGSEGRTAAGRARHQLLLTRAAQKVAGSSQSHGHPCIHLPVPLEPLPGLPKRPW